MINEVLINLFLLEVHYYMLVILNWTLKNIANEKSSDIRNNQNISIQSIPIKIENGHFCFFGDIKNVKDKFINLPNQGYNNNDYLNHDNFIKQITEFKDII